jgi:opacity protein-like surface antigen
MKANSTVNGLSGTVDLTFGDVLDYLNFTALGRVEAWNGKWGLTFDGTYMFLGANGSFHGRRDVVRFNLNADVRLGMADFGLAYRIYEQRFGNNDEQCLILEPYGGLRYAYLRQRIDLNVDLGEVGSRGATLGTSEDWVEPFVGGRVVLKLNDQWSLNTRADAGGFGIGSASDLTWQVAGGVDYKITKNITFNGGYRYVDLDYSRGSGSDEFGIRLKAQGPILGLTITF